VKVSGTVIDESGSPVAGVKVSALEKSPVSSKAFETTTDSGGVFTITGINYSSFSLNFSLSGKKTVQVENLGNSTDYDNICIIQPAGSGTASISVPGIIQLSAVRSGSNAVLSWTAPSSSDFSYYTIMRSGSAGVNMLSCNVGKITGASTKTMTDKNLAAGVWYYRAYYVSGSSGAKLMLASNETAVTMPSENAFPSKIAMLMLKTLPAEGGGYDNQARYVATTTDIYGLIPQGINVGVSSPLFDSTQKAQYALTPYKKIKNYYYGNPGICLGETKMPGEWESKYYVSKDSYASDACIGSHRMGIDGQAVTLADITTAQPSSKIVTPSIIKNADGSLEISWKMFQDGTSFSGGAGNYGWKYLVKVMYEGAYSGGTDPTYQYEKYWSNTCIKDMGFHRICEVVVNMPQDEGNKVTIPAGVFSTGNQLQVAIYAISTTQTAVNPVSGASGYGKAYMYWLYYGGSTLTVP
jgi:hypothetical protein